MDIDLELGFWLKGPYVWTGKSNTKISSWADENVSRQYILFDDTDVYTENGKKIKVSKLQPDRKYYVFDFSQSPADCEYVKKYFQVYAGGKQCMEDLNLRFVGMNLWPLMKHVHKNKCYDDPESLYEIFYMDDTLEDLYDGASIHDEGVLVKQLSEERKNIIPIIKGIKRIPLDVGYNDLLKAMVELEVADNKILSIQEGEQLSGEEIKEIRVDARKGYVEQAKYLASQQSSKIKQGISDTLDQLANDDAQVKKYTKLLNLVDETDDPEKANEIKKEIDKLEKLPKVKEYENLFNELEDFDEKDVPEKEKVKILQEQYDKLLEGIRRYVIEGVYKDEDEDEDNFLDSEDEVWNPSNDESSETSSETLISTEESLYDSDGESVSEEILSDIFSSESEASTDEVPYGKEEPKPRRRITPILITEEESDDETWEDV